MDKDKPIDPVPIPEPDIKEIRRLWLDSIQLRGGYNYQQGQGCGVSPGLKARDSELIHLARSFWFSKGDVAADNIALEICNYFGFECGKAQRIANIIRAHKPDHLPK